MNQERCYKCIDKDGNPEPTCEVCLGAGFILEEDEEGSLYAAQCIKKNCQHTGPSFVVNKKKPLPGKFPLHACAMCGGNTKWALVGWSGAST